MVKGKEITLREKGTVGRGKEWVEEGQCGRGREQVERVRNG